MSHLALVPFTGLRVREEAMRELGMKLPALRRRASAIAALPPLGLLTLAGMTPEPWTCSYHQSSGTIDELVAEVCEAQPTLVAVSALTASINEAYAFSRRLRRHNVPVVLGGLHASVCPDEASQHVDAVVVGEGESIWQTLLDDAAAKTLKPVYSSVGTFDWQPDLLPRYELLAGRSFPRFTLQTQRGCPFACDFCGASRLISRHRVKPLELIHLELEAIARLDPRPVIELADDNTFAGRDDAAQLLELLRQSGARWFTEADWRTGERPDVLAHLSEAGCVQLLVGIESLVFRYTGMGAKQADLGRMMDAVVAIQEAGVAVNGCFIIGADGETPASIDRLVEFILDSPLAEVQFTLQTPFPGTALYHRLRRTGRLLPDRDWSHYTLFDGTFQPDRMSVAELESAFRNAVRDVFSPQAVSARESIRKDIVRRRRGHTGLLDERELTT